MRTVFVLTITILVGVSCAIAADTTRPRIKLPDLPSETLRDNAPDTLERARAQKEMTTLKERYKIWGAIAFAKGKTHPKDYIVTSVVLNEPGWENAKQKAYSACTERKVGSCSVVTFPGCVFVIVGRRLKEMVPVFGINSKPEKLVQECIDQGFQCSPPIGGCNYVDEEGGNSYAHKDSKNPIKTAEWIIETEE